MWSFTVPAGLGPDEGAHYSLARFFAEHERVPEFGADPGMGVEAATTGEGGVVGYFSYAGQPQLPYVIAGALVMLPPDSEWMDVRQARAPGAAWLSLTTIFAFLLARRLTGSGSLAAAVAVMTAAWPHLTFVNAYVNQDAYTVMASSGLMWSWWRGADHGWRWRDAILTGLFFGLVVQGKFTGTVLLALTVIVVAATVPGGIRNRLLRLGAMLISAVIVAGWWLWTAIGLYGSDIYASGRAAELASKLDIASGAFRDNSDLSVTGMLLETPWIMMTLNSFVGGVGTWGYLLMASIITFGLLGALLRFVRWASPGAERDRPRAILLACTFAPIIIMPVLSIRHSYLVDFQPQGRYLFSALIPFIIVLAIGLRELGTTRMRAGALLVVGAAFTLVSNAMELFDTLLGGYGVSLLDWQGQWQIVVVCAWAAAGCVLLGWSIYASRAAQAESRERSPRA